MGNRLYVGNLSFNTSESDLRQEFEKCGKVTDAKIVTDRETGRSRGFGFVQYSTEGEATAAIQAFNGAQVGGRDLVVNIAEDRRPNSGGGGGGSPRNFGGAPRSGGGQGGGGYNSNGGYSSGSPPSGGQGGGRGGGRSGGKGSRRRRDDNDYG